MTARCPADPTHNRFLTSAHVVEDWLVDERGNWLETVATVETAHGPDPENEWVCRECGAVAIVTR